MIDIFKVTNPNHYFFLASPYSHATREKREERYQAALSATAWLIQNKIWTFSPILHCHPFVVSHRLATEADYWRDYNAAMQSSAIGTIVLCIDGFYDSVGCRGEVESEKVLLQDFIDIRFPLQSMTPDHDSGYVLEYRNPYAE